MGTYTKDTSDQSFNSDVLQSSKPVLVDFWAEWCGPCRAMAPKLEEIGQETEGQLSVVKLNVDENRESATKFRVMSIPTLILFKAGNEIERIEGNRPKEDVLNALKPHIG